MSLFRSRAKILSPISHNYISIPRSASEQSRKSDFKHPISEVPCIKNAAKTQDQEVQKTQVSPSRSLFSLFRKKGQIALEETMTSIPQEKKDDSWLTKLFAKQPRPITPQGKSMIESRKVQNKQLLGKLSTTEWKPSAFIIKNNNTPESKLTCTSDPPSKPQQILPSANARPKKILTKKHTNSPNIEKEEDMRKETPNFPDAELKSQKEKISENLGMENCVNKKPCNIDVLGGKERSISTQGHMINRELSSDTQHSVESTKSIFAGIQPNKVLIHTNKQNVQYFTHRNSVQPRSYAKITGHSLQMQVKHRKHMLAQIKNNTYLNILPAGKTESYNQEKTAKNFKIIHKISELSTLHVTPKSLTCIPKLSTENRNKTFIKFPSSIKNQEVLNKGEKIDNLKIAYKVNSPKTMQQMLAKSIKDENVTSSIQQMNFQKKEARFFHNSSKAKNGASHVIMGTSKYGHTHVIGMTPNKISKITDLPNLEKEVTENEQKSTTIELKVSGKNAQSVPTFELKKWIKRIEAKEHILCHDSIDTKSLPGNNRDKIKQIPSHKKIKYLKKDFISKDILCEKIHEHLGSNKPVLSNSYTKNASQFINKTHAFHIPLKLRTAHSLNTLQLSSKNNELLAQKESTTPKISNDQVSKYFLKPEEPLWQNFISFTGANNDESDTQRNITYKIGDKMSNSGKSQAHNLYLRKDQLTSFHTKVSELSKRSPSENRSNLNYLLSKERTKTSEIFPSKIPAINQQPVLNRNNNIKSVKHNINMKSESIMNQNGNMTTETFKIKQNEINTKLNDHSSLTDVDKLSGSSDKNNLEYLLNKSISVHNTSKNLKTHLTNETFSKNKIDNTETFLRKIYDKQPKNLESNHIEQLQAKVQSTTTIHRNSQITHNFENTKKHFPQRPINDSVPYQHFVDKQVMLDDKHDSLENKNVNKKVDKQEVNSENTLQSSSKDGDNCDGGVKGDIIEEINGNINEDKIKCTSHKELITENFTQNCSSGKNESLELIHDTIQPQSDKSLVPIETNNPIMNNWTFSNIAAYFYGAIFSKQDMINLDLHNAIEQNKKHHPVIVDRELKEIFNTKPNNMNLEQIHSEAKKSCTTQELETKTTHCKFEINDEKITKLISENETTPRSETTTANTNHGTQKYENKQDLRHTVENRDKITQNTTGIVKSMLTTNSLTLSSKRNYSSRKIQEPFNFGPSSLECKKKSKEKPNKKKDICKRKHKSGDKKQVICPEKKERELNFKRISMPGCARPPITKCCVESSYTAIPCVKKEPPVPSFSECLKYPLVEHKSTECDCLGGTKKLKKCSSVHEKPKLYNACKKETKKELSKKQKDEEELVDDDEGEFPPCKK